jgi:hypothetical protein
LAVPPVLVVDFNRRARSQPERTRREDRCSKFYGRRDNLATPILYPLDGERFIVYAANAGAHRTPAWWLNLWGAGEGTAPFASVTPSRSQ